MNSSRLSVSTEAKSSNLDWSGTDIKCKVCLSLTQTILKASQLCNVKSERLFERRLPAHSPEFKENAMAQCSCLSCINCENMVNALSPCVYGTCTGDNQQIYRNSTRAFNKLPILEKTSDSSHLQAGTALKVKKLVLVGLIINANCQALYYRGKKACR